MAEEINNIIGLVMGTEVGDVEGKGLRLFLS